MPKLFIPALGTRLALASPWTLTVYGEYRNMSLVDLADLREEQKRAYAGVRYRGTVALGTFTFPVGTVLVVDRIYIRQGGEDYNSVTFRASGYTTEVRPGLKGKKEKVVRFWAKLDEVNTMEIA